MDRDREYQIALELASTSRYREAQGVLQRILERGPDDVEALILLGKVEYYLRLYRSSRTRFETALLYEPENVTAFFGVQFYRERTRGRAFAALLAAAVLVLSAVGIGLYLRLHGSLRHGLDELERQACSRREELLARIGRLEAMLEESTAAFADAERHITAGVVELSAKTAESVDLFGQTRQEIGSAVQGLAETAGCQAELQQGLGSAVQMLIREIEGLRLELDRLR